MCVIETSPVVETRRLILRAPGAQDVTRIAALANDRDIARMTKRMPHPFRVDDAEDFVLQVASQDPKKAKAPASRTRTKKKADAIVPPTAEKPQPGAVC